MMTIKISSKIQEHLFMTGLSLSTVYIFLTITIYMCEKSKNNQESTLRGHASLFNHTYAYGRKNKKLNGDRQRRKVKWEKEMDICGVYISRVLPEGPNFTSWTSLVYCFPFVGRCYSRIALIPPIRHQKPLLAHPQTL